MCADSLPICNRRNALTQRGKIDDAAKAVKAREADAPCCEGAVQVAPSSISSRSSAGIATNKHIEKVTSGGYSTHLQALPRPGLVPGMCAYLCRVPALLAPTDDEHHQKQQRKQYMESCAFTSKRCARRPSPAQYELGCGL